MSVKTPVPPIDLVQKQTTSSVFFNILPPVTGSRKSQRAVMRFEHTTIGLCLFCLLALLLSACNLFGDSGTATRSQVKAPASNQVYRIPLVGMEDVTTLDPTQARDSGTVSAIQMLYTGLVSLDDKLQARPQLAASWDVSPDGLTWTFHLKANLKFSDGTKLTADDVAYSIDRALQPATQSPVAPLYLKVIKHADQLLAGHSTTLIGDSLNVINPQTIAITTEEPTAYLPYLLALPCASVVEKSLIQQDSAAFTKAQTNGGSSGPFKVAQYTHRDSLTLVPNSSYYGKRPQLQKVIFKLYTTQSLTYQDYQNRLLDVTEVPLANYPNDKKKDHEFHQVSQDWINYYTMNYLAKPFDNIHIRQAFALAIDKEAIVHTIWKDTAIATNHIVPAGVTGYNADLTGPDDTKSLTGDTQKAKNLLQQGLQEEGWADVSAMPDITLTYVSGVDTFDQEVQALVQRWQKVLNVRVTPNPIDLNTLLDQVTATTNNANGLQMWGLSWVGEYADPHDWLTLQFGKGATNNNMNYGANTSKTAAQQQTMQQLLEDSDQMTATNQAQARLQHYQQAEQQIVNDVGWLPIEQETSIFLRTPSIVGITDNAQGSIPPDDWAMIYRVQ